MLCKILLAQSTDHTYLDGTTMHTNIASTYFQVVSYRQIGNEMELENCLLLITYLSYHIILSRHARTAVEMEQNKSTKK